VFTGLNLPTRARHERNGNTAPATKAAQSRRKEQSMNEISYFRVGDYMLPNLTLSDPPNSPPFGHCGEMRTSSKEHNPIAYNQLLLTEKLYPHLINVDIIENERRKNGVLESVVIKEIVCEL
jgi:hypothetical protein